jgi:glycosyltransferase involved in cell wall biosynthesis
VLPQRVTIIERRAVRAADQIWVCSDEDCRLIRELYEPLAPIFVVPNAVDVDAYQAACTMDSRHRTVSSTSKVLLFPAAFQWEPNAACAKILIDEVFPPCRHFPGLSSYARRQRPDRIVVSGTITDIMLFFAAASVVVVPLRQGSGTRFKILKAFAAGVPVISTKKGPEGLDVRDQIHLVFAESGDQLVDAVRKIWLEEGLANRLVANGLELVRRAYSWPAISSVLHAALEDLGRNN